MAVRFYEIWLLVGVVFIVKLPATRGQLCPPGWTFHNLTGSCMTLVRKSHSYLDARHYCQYYSRSSVTTMESHLVFILDEATDNFVKDLLDEQGVNSALIGLHDRVGNGDYVWDNNSTMPTNYTGWAVNPHTPEVYKRAVVTTKDGWKEYDETSAAYFVCQFSAAKLPDILCSHQFVQEKARTTCTAAQVYPQVECAWKVNYLKRPLTVYDKTVSNVVDNTDGYYRATCTASFYVNHAGIYDVSVSMALTLPNSRVQEVKDTSVSVAPPQQPPQLYRAGQILQTSWMDVVENQTLILTCHVPGGDPRVYRTIITCINIQQFDGSSVTMSVRVTREFNGRSCTCSALHAAGYTQTKKVGIWVNYPATVTSFGVARSNIKRGDEITFSCEATGNPVPQLTIQRQNGPTLTNSSTGDLTYQKRATCSDSGKYVCLASNIIPGKHYHDNRVVGLQVRCAPEHCNVTSSPIFPAAVGVPSASIKLCARAYPAPTSFILYKGNTTYNRLRTDKFQAYFIFTNEEEGLGEITVILSRFTQEDMGEYTLYSEYILSGVPDLYSYLKFSIFAQGTYQFKDPDSLSRIYTGQINGVVSIHVSVVGYPEPTVTLNSTKHILSSDAYTLNYTHLEPPYGTVSLVINIQNARFFQNYSLNIINAEGPLSYSFEIVEGDPVPENEVFPVQFVAATVVCIVAALIVIIIIVLKRKEEAPEAQAPEDPHYMEIIDFRSDMPETPVHYPHPAPEDPAYLDIIDFVYDMPDCPVPYSNKNLLNARDGDVEYEYAVSGL